MTRLLVVVLLLAMPAAAAPVGSPAATATTVGQRRFEAATALEAEGKLGPAAAALEQLANDLPDDPFAVDALFEAAVLHEERLSSPARAADLYDQIVKRFPQSRLSRRAQTRSQALRVGLASGEGPLREYRDLIGESARLPRAQSIEKMERLLERHPDFALAAQALLWLGKAYAAERRWSEAEARLRIVEQKYASDEAAPTARRARAEVLVALGRSDEARAIFEDQLKSADPVVRAAAVEGLHALATLTLRRQWLWVALGYLLMFASLHLWLARSRLRLVGSDLLYFVPVAGLFVLASLTENAAIARAVAMMATGGALLVWLSGSLSVVRPALGRERVGRAFANALAATAIFYVAVQSNGLSELVRETLSAGADR